MKTGIEIIAEWRNEVYYFGTLAHTGCGNIKEKISKLMGSYSIQLGIESRIANLAKVGALIAAEIDWLNNVKQK